MAILHCMTCKKQHASTFFRCSHCSYTSCQGKDGGGARKCPSCGKQGTRKQVKG